MNVIQKKILFVPFFLFAQNTMLVVINFEFSSQTSNFDQHK